MFKKNDNEFNNNKIHVPKKDEFITSNYFVDKDGTIDISEPPVSKENDFYNPCNGSGYYESW